MSLLLRIVISSVLGIVAFAFLLFVPAGTLDYWQGWTLLAVFTAMSLAPTMFLNRVDPAAIERRTHAGVKAETRPTQKVVIAGTFVVFGAMLVVPALDYRFGWSHVPGWLSVVGDVMVAAGLGLAMLVVFQNRYASANITVEDGQPLVSTGLYGIVRHPMYFGNTILMIGIVLALGSYWSLLLVPIGLALMVVRIIDEEKLLRAELDGYEQYTQKVRYRLVPLIW
ncbi:methyltransferase family protein [Mycolicibacterium vinylchloridicum]|uniref:methyltransferase family protein n=1 Tax=Mycolicibacterium vinylchloridicum TaxID=2736928 RepID=UPI0015CC4396|nr:isoprenylcysteine carboxylmethyltransferase family protein [Mycolicibacterium vinylchloridicum]